MSELDVKRMEHLERMVLLQWLVLGVVVLLAATGAAAVLVFQPWRDLTVERLRVVDRSGNERIRLSTADVGSTIQVTDELGTVRISLFATSDHSRVGVHGDDALTPQATLGRNNKGPFVWLSDDGGDVRGSFTVTKENASLILSAAGEEESISLFAEPFTTHLRVRDRVGSTRCIVGMFESGPALVLADGREEPAAAFRLKDNSPLILLKDPSGNTLWRVPELPKP